MVRLSRAHRLQRLSAAAAARHARHGVAAAECLHLLGVPVFRHVPLRRASPSARRRTPAGSTTRRMRCVPFNPGPNIDFYALANILLGISTTLGSINFIVTLLRMRAPGMSINRLPIMSWGTLTVSVGQPSRRCRPSAWRSSCSGWTGSSARISSTSPGGGQPLLWQHLFWMWGHPWVYAIVLPAISMVSEALPVLLPPSARRLYRRGAGDRADHGARLRRLAAPHVRDRPADHGAVVLQRGLASSSPFRARSRCSPGSRRSGPAVRSSPPPSCSSPGSSSCSSSAASPAS